MTRRRVSHLVATMLAVVAFASPSGAAPRGAKEWTERDGLDRMSDPTIPLVFRASAGTTWVQVHPNGLSPCSPADTVGSGSPQALERVWCFEGAGGDSSWPLKPGHTFTHWARYNPPIPEFSRWHVTTRHPGASTGTYNAWAGCDSTGGNPACVDMAFWVFKDGYGAEWNYSLILDASGQDASSGGTLKFDIRYDTECNYDYIYLEYFNTTTQSWALMNGTGARPGYFNGVSGNVDVFHGGTGRACGDDYFFHSDQADIGGTITNVNGNSVWLTNVQFPLPAQAQGMQIRWRAFSDPLWNDADGQGDTDGLGAIDNVQVTFAASGSVVTDNFETGDMDGISATIGSASWFAGGLEGSQYDGWHLEFDPKYKNKGNTCEFSNDWMWAAKPAAGPIADNAFSYFLVAPKINVDGWTGGIVEYSTYQCMPDDLNDYSDQLVRTYSATAGAWSLWANFDGFVLFGGCDFWNFNQTELLSPYLGADVDSLQVAWEVLDQDTPGTFEWGKHGSVQYLIDNVSFGRFDASATTFTARAIDIFVDTFSRSDAAHTSALQNSELSNWVGTGGSRVFIEADSLSVQVTDVDGITAGNVRLWWRRDTGPGSPFGAWNSIVMGLGAPLPASTSDEGTYRGIIGKDNGGIEDMTASGDGLIWNAGTTVQYYVRATDNFANAATFPTTAVDPQPVYFEFSILPFNNTTSGQGNKKLLLVDDYSANTLDFEASSGFNATGGVGFGGFDTPDFRSAEDLYEEVLADLGLAYDKFDVAGAGSSLQSEPTGVSDVTQGLGGYMDDLGNPRYDAIVWFHGNQSQYTLADTTRLELRTFLDRGGKLLAFGDDIARDLGTAGNNADSTIQFLSNYFGSAFTNINDDATIDRALNLRGSAGTSLANLTFGLYGECPVRLSFDRLALSTPGVGQANSILLTYTAGAAGDEGRIAAVKNVRTLSGGVAILAAFDLTRLVSRTARACMLGKMLENELGFTVPVNFACVNGGVDAPVVSGARFGFDLAEASPNPFAKATQIKFSVPARGHVTLEVFNVLGQRIRTLVDETLEPNAYTREWDGRSDQGQRASSGIYFYKLVSGNFSETKKAVLLK